MTETIWHQQTIDSYLQALGEANTDPAGGAQAALLGAQACAMASMVVRFTLSNKKYAPLHERAWVWLDGLAASQKTLLNLMQEDVRALNAMSHTWSIPKDDPTRPAKIQEALIRGAEVPRQMAEAIITVIPIFEELMQSGNQNLLSDSMMAADMAASSASCALYNIKINSKYMKNEQMKKAFNSLAGDWMKQVDSLRHFIAHIVRERLE